MSLFVIPCRRQKKFQNGFSSTVSFHLEKLSVGEFSLKNHFISLFISFLLTFSMSQSLYTCWNSCVRARFQSFSWYWAALASCHRLDRKEICCWCCCCSWLELVRRCSMMRSWCMYSSEKFHAEIGLSIDFCVQFIALNQIEFWFFFHVLPHKFMNSGERKNAVKLIDLCYIGQTLYDFIIVAILRLNGCTKCRLYYTINIHI